MPMAVEPSLIASREYSTWKRRPSGEKVLLGGGEVGWLAELVMGWTGMAGTLKLERSVREKGMGQKRGLLDTPICKDMLAICDLRYATLLSGMDRADGGGRTVF